MDNKQADSSVSTQAQWELHLQQALPLALENNQFFICLQPIFEMPTRRIIGAEALLRWNKPDAGILFPSEFLPAAQRAGLLLPLDIFALGEVCNISARWQAAAGIPLLPVNINISRESLLSPHFLELVSQIITGCDVPHNLIECELDAQTVQLHALEAKQAVQRLRQLGCRSAIHGFKESPSILPRLLPLGFDTIKVNCRFYAPHSAPAGIASCMEAYTAVRENGVVAICEGVEFLDHLVMLEQAGCNTMQGYALCMPVTARLFAEMAQRHT